MRCYNHLYVGDKAKKRRFEILKDLRKGKSQPGIHVITPPQNGNNILDIYPSYMLFMPPYKERDLMVIGIAADYWEALEVVRTIVDDLYQAGKELSLESLLKKEEQ